MTSDVANTFIAMNCLVVLVVIFGTVVCEEEKVFRVVGTDSYLEAYKASHGDSVNSLLDDAVKKTDRDYVEPGVYPYPQPQYGSPTGPSGPSGPDYGPPRPQYGPSNLRPVYGPPNPAPVYGPPNPAPVYSPPIPPPVYGPPAPPPVYNAPSSVQVFYGMPHAMLSIWDKLKLKWDLFTIGKILLKLVIFKKIVSFIAIICLLLFIPALKHKNESSDDDDMMRNINYRTSSDEKLNQLSTFVLEAIENFASRKNESTTCDSIHCKTEVVLKQLNTKMSYKKLAKLYSKELQ